MTSVEKVLGGMIAINDIFLTDALKGFVGSKDLRLIIIVIVLTMIMKNSFEWSEKFKPTVTFKILTIALLLYGILSLSKVSQFLYFQF